MLLLAALVGAIVVEPARPDRRSGGSADAPGHPVRHRRAAVRPRRVRRAGPAQRGPGADGRRADAQRGQPGAVTADATVEAALPHERAGVRAVRDRAGRRRDRRRAGDRAAALPAARRRSPSTRCARRPAGRRRRRRSRDRASDAGERDGASRSAAPLPLRRRASRRWSGSCCRSARRRGAAGARHRAAPAAVAGRRGLRSPSRVDDAGRETRRRRWPTSASSSVTVGVRLDAGRRAGGGRGRRGRARRAGLLGRPTCADDDRYAPVRRAGRRCSPPRCCWSWSPAT